MEQSVDRLVSARISAPVGVALVMAAMVLVVPVEVLRRAQETQADRVKRLWVTRAVMLEVPGKQAGVGAQGRLALMGVPEPERARVSLVALVPPHR